MEDPLKVDKTVLSGFVENMKQKVVVNRLMDIIRDECREIYDALIGERDAFMARSISTSNGKTIVGVVGLAHLQGIERNLRNSGFKSIARNCPNVK